jgi:LacI family transcriptional regulator
MRVSAVAMTKRTTKNTRAAKLERVTLPIAMVFGYDRRGCTGMLQGIGRYARGCDNWALVSVFPQNRLSEALYALKPAGIIVGECCQGIAGILRKIARPVVSTCLILTAPDFHQVACDEASIGSMAARHLLERGLRNFGYFGPPWNSPTINREGGFCQTLRGLSHTVSTCYVRPAGKDTRIGTFESKKHVLQWVRQLHRPAGIFAPLDTWALWLCGVCRQEGIKVPEEIAIIGAGDDQLLCELSHPSISSIVFPYERVGYEAAAMLDRLINREPVSDKPFFLPAVGTVTRQSTDVWAVADPDLTPAINYMREHISEAVKIKDVLRHTRLPRWSFERKFRAALGQSPAQEIRCMRIAMAKTLLSGNPEMKLASVAHRCGFSNVAHFSNAFHQATDLTPAAWRLAVQQTTSHGRRSSIANSSATPSVKKRRFAARGPS